jgi:hypothetical protein
MRQVQIMRFERNTPDSCSLTETGFRDVETALRSLLIAGTQVMMLNALCVLLT